jgi:DNA-binding protein Fis
MSEIEQSYIDLVLKHTNQNKTRAAEILGLSLRTLHNRVKATSQVNGKEAKVAVG